MFIHVVVSWVDFPISMATFNHHLHWLLVAKWLSSQLGPTSLANSCRSVEKTSVAFGGKNYSTSYGYTPWSKQMVFTSQKENDISSNNQSQPTWACIWNHMKYKQVLYSILTLKWNWQILKDADQHSSQEFYVQDAVPIGLPGAWPSTMFFTHGKKWVTLHWQIRCLRSCEFINWILLRGFVGIYSFSLFLEILAWNRWIFGPVISSGRGSQRWLRSALVSAFFVRHWPSTWKFPTHQGCYKCPTNNGRPMKQASHHHLTETCLDEAPA